MEGNLAINKLSIEHKSKTASVPSDDLAKLMYYLHSVYDVLEFPDLVPYIDYKNYDDLSSQEIQKVIIYAKLFNPTEMTSIKAFIQDEGLSNMNEFFNISDETYGIHVNEDFVVGGKVVKVLSVMVYKKEWILKNYYLPLERITNPKPNPQPKSPKRTNEPSDDDSDPCDNLIKDCEGAYCGCIIF